MLERFATVVEALVIEEDALAAEQLGAPQGAAGALATARARPGRAGAVTRMVRRCHRSALRSLLVASGVKLE
jgi:hypothetical protein